MTTNYDLVNTKARNLSDYTIDELTDITEIAFDAETTVANRIFQFLRMVENPYVFKVDDTPIKIVFSENSLTLQDSLVKVFNQMT